MAHVDPDVTNDVNGRTFQGLYLGPTGNIQGTVRCLALVTGCVKNVKNFTEVHMPESAVDLVNKWGKRYQKEKKNKMVEYLNRLKQRFAWDNDKYDILEEETPHANIPAKFPGIVLDHNETWNPFWN